MAFGSMASRSFVILLSTRKPSAPIFRVEGAIKMETEFSSKRRHPRRPETLMRMFPSWEFQGGSRRVGARRPPPPPPSNQWLMRIYVSYWSYFSYRILFFVIKHLRTAVTVPWIRHCQKPLRFMYSVLYIGQDVWFHFFFFFFFVISSTYISLRLTRDPFLELKGGLLFAECCTPHLACFWMKLLY